MFDHDIGVQYTQLIKLENSISLGILALLQVKHTYRASREKLLGRGWDSNPRPSYTSPKYTVPYKYWFSLAAETPQGQLKLSCTNTIGDFCDMSLHGVDGLIGEFRQSQYLNPVSKTKISALTPENYLTILRQKISVWVELSSVLKFQFY